MKKFLKKKEVMWTFLGVAIGFLVLYACLLIRPVTTITPYKGTYEGVEATYTFKGGNKVEVKGEGESKEYWVAYDFYAFIPGGRTSSMTRKEFLDQVKDAKENNKDLYEAALVDVNAFRIKMDLAGGKTIVMRNTGAIVFAVVGGLVEATLITFAVMSVLANKKKA
ncbi:MAG: hypothetical protein IJW32_02280 [Clostridia bacterium]|nr:hypothetical protein [Clostridia bacterium]